MVTVIGEVLIDEFPDYSRIGGAPFNFAANLHRLGEPVRLVTRIGPDAAGARITAALRDIGLDDAGLQTDAAKPTGRVRVTPADDGSHRFEILPDTAFDRIAPAAPEPRTRMVYFGTLAQRTPGGFERIQQMVASQPEGAQRMLDLNLRPGGFTPETVERSLSQAQVLKLSEEEWEAVGDMLAPATPRAALGDWLMRRYPVRLIALTRGAAGAEILTADGRRYREPSPRPAQLVDTVGAGDGFAAVLAAGLLQQRPLRRVLRAAAAFAAGVCAVAGALPADNRLYRAATAALEGIDHAG